MIPTLKKFFRRRLWLHSNGYIGKTERKFKERLADHKGSVRNCAKNGIWVHFNGRGHLVENLKMTAIKKVYARGEEIILKIESLWINLFKAEYQGLNSRK